MQLSILIRNLNEAAHLRLTLERIRKQVCDFHYEIVVVDNESDDDSVYIAKAAGARVISLARSAFSYGRALNVGVRACEGEFILAISAHIILLNEFFLASIPGYFEDKQVAALRFTQPVYVGDVMESLTNGPQILRLNDDPGFAVEHWSRLMINHCSAFRRSCWELLPFDESLPDAEDKHWILQLMQKGYCMLYHVPLFYTYSKPVIHEKKILATIRGYHGKWLVTGSTDLLFEQSYTGFMFNKLKQELRRMRMQLSIHRQEFKGIQSFQKKKQR